MKRWLQGPPVNENIFLCRIYLENRRNDSLLANCRGSMPWLGKDFDIQFGKFLKGLALFCRMMRLISIVSQCLLFVIVDGLFLVFYCMDLL